MRFRCIVFIFAFLLPIYDATSDVVDSRMGKLEFKRGRALLNGQPLNIASSFPENSSIDLFDEGLWDGSDDTPLRQSLFLLSYFFENGNQLQKGYLILDMRNGGSQLSNPIAIDEIYNWGDNHYAFIKNDTLYFGVYETDMYRVHKMGKPLPKQFIYKDGVLKENTGPWVGPAKPEKYIEPENPTDPCFNVTGREECEAEIARDKAEAARKKRAAVKSQTSKPTSSTNTAH